MTLDTASVSEEFALEGTEGKWGGMHEGKQRAQRGGSGASGRHEGKTGGWRLSAGGTKG